VWTDEKTVAAGHRIDPARWRAAFEVAMSRIAGRFARYEPRLRARRLVLGAKSRHKKPENLRRYFKPSPEAIAEVTSLLAPGDSRR
jgi:hypothetical protein